MTARPIIWATGLIVYAVFFAWYTNLDGALSEDEIDAFLVIMHKNNPSPERIALLEEFMRSDTGNDFVMVNNLDLNETPPDLPATGPGADPGQLLDYYMEHMYPAQFARASHPIFFGQVIADAMDISGIENGEHWDQGALFRYRSRRDILEIALDPKFAERHDYKMAALTKTIAYPVEPTINIGELRFVMALLLFSLLSALDLILYRRRE